MQTNVNYTFVIGIPISTNQSLIWETICGHLNHEWLSVNLFRRVWSHCIRYVSWGITHSCEVIHFHVWLYKNDFQHTLGELFSPSITWFTALHWNAKFIGMSNSELKSVLCAVTVHMWYVCHGAIFNGSSCGIVFVHSSLVTGWLTFP